MSDKKASGLNDSGKRAASKDGAEYEPRDFGGRFDLIPSYIIKEFFDHMDEYPKLFGNKSVYINYILQMIYTYPTEANSVQESDSDWVCTWPLYYALAAAMQLGEKHYTKKDFDDTYTSSLLHLSILYERGAIKYCSRNWEKGLEQSHRFNSLNRHIHKFNMDMDDEDHMAAIIWNIIALIYYHRMSEYRDLI